VTKNTQQSFSVLALRSPQSVQNLWSGYGNITRYFSDTLQRPVMVKQVAPPVDPTTSVHPRGWNTTLSHQRKLRSYETEMCFYRDFLVKEEPGKPNKNASQSKHSLGFMTPELIASESSQHSWTLVLEDLDAQGFNQRAMKLDPVRSQDWQLLKNCLSWLANFHSSFLHNSGCGLWQQGSYWHLDTRPDELASMSESALKQAAFEIDKRLQDCQYQTLVHGDAKIANFCINPDTLAVAALDFQYVGKGVGIKDVMLFLGSCLNSEQLFSYETQLLDHYFSVLKQAMQTAGREQEYDELASEWRKLYPFAWADFHRFLAGWKPDHSKINAYMLSQTQACLALLSPLT